MKIIDNSKKCTFSELAVGDVFAFNNNIGYYMRIGNHTNHNGYHVNAINLEYGTDFDCSSESIVKKVDATLVIGTVPVVENLIVTEEENETKEESEIEKLKKTTLAEIAEYCRGAQNKPCQGCPIYKYCIDTDIVKTFAENLYDYFNK